MAIFSFYNTANQQLAANKKPKEERKPRTKLQKPRTRSSSLHSRAEVVRTPNHYPGQFFYDDDAVTRVATRVARVNPAANFNHRQIPTQPLIKKKASCRSIHSLKSISHYPEDEMDDSYVRRAKTPCLWIGALDSQPVYDSLDTAKALADQYQELLPPRIFTPHPNDTHKGPRKPLRKVKGQQSLRDLVTCHTLSMTSTTSRTSSDLSGSDSDDTLVGSPTSQVSPQSEHFPDFDKSPFQEVEPKVLPTLGEENDIGFQICLDLLTTELATALFKTHPAEGLQKASHLQILLMIEAYEAVQQRIQTNPQQGSHMAPVLDNWLAALYSLYDENSSSRPTSFHSFKSSLSGIPALPRKSSKRHSRKTSSGFGDLRFDSKDNQKPIAFGDRGEIPT